ncbi:MAG: replication-associated recombination protein A, partial [Micromonosporaceae bacterium]|nr:replication-associated recombination protein A [Micromonosporaceae bacterium]
GDVRKALTALEAAAASAAAQGAAAIDLPMAEQAVDIAALRYDRAGDEHYDIVSAFIKSMRGSDVDAALHWLARMLAAGEDARFVARRLVIFASEDIGLADPTALVAATAAATAVAQVGLPEGRINLAQAVIHLAAAPKSNAVIAAIDAALADVRAGQGGRVPRHLRDAHYRGAKGLGHGAGYRYPHDDPRGVVTQRYAPDGLTDREYYRPSRHGAERAMAERLPRLRRIVRGTAEASQPIQGQPGGALDQPGGVGTPLGGAVSQPGGAGTPPHSDSATDGSKERHR